jgi:hypothetical protein
MQNNAIYIFKESERNQLGNINKWRDIPSFVFCYKFY